MKQATSHEEIMQRLNAMCDGTDEEVSHSEADMLLCDALLMVGESAVVDAYLAARERVGFWYA